MSSSNTPARPITSDELIKIQAEGPWCEIGLDIQRPAIMYQMRIDQTFTSLDKVVELIYTDGSGTYTNAVAGMTILVSGIGYGKHEKGVLRLRKDLPSDVVGVVSINETSAIQFANGDYLTVVESMSIWQKDLSIEGSSIFMDKDIAFGDPMNYGPIGRVGPEVAITLIDPLSGVAEFYPLDPSFSACYDGASIVGYHYECPGAFLVEDADTTSPKFTFNAAGRYLWWCEITDDAGRTTKNYRWIVINPISEKFELLSCSGSFSRGDWSAKFRCYSDLSDIYDRAMVTLYISVEVYGGLQEMIGRLPGYEKILATGWIDEKTININSIAGYVEFDVLGPASWLSKIRCFPYGVEDTSGAPTNWVQIQELTVDKALAYLLFWRSTATSVMDCFFSGSSLRLKALSSPAENLWQQITDMTLGTIMAKPLINSLGQMYVEIDTQVISSADQALLPLVQYFQKRDYEKGFSLQINGETKVSLLELSGISAWDGTSATPLISKAPGNIGDTYGAPANEENYLFASQDECNRIAGALYAVQNNPYEMIDLELAGLNNFFDICPRQLAAIDISADDNPLGLELTAAKLIPREISLEYNEETGFLKRTLGLEFLVSPINGITYIPPTPLNNSDFSTPEINVPNFPVPDTWFPISIPSPLPASPCSNYAPSIYRTAWDKVEIHSSDTTLIARCYFPCKLHAAGGANKLSRVSGVGGAPYHIYAISGGARIATSNALGQFETPDQTIVDGFEVELDTTLGGDVQFTGGYSPGSGTMEFTLINPWTVHVELTPPWDPYDAKVNIGIQDIGHRTATIAATLNYSFLSKADAPGAGYQNFSREFGPLVTAVLGGAVKISGDAITFYGATGFNLVLWTGLFPNVYGSRIFSADVLLNETGYIDPGSRILLTPAAIIENVCPVDES